MRRDRLLAELLFERRWITADVQAANLDVLGRVSTTPDENRRRCLPSLPRSSTMSHSRPGEA
jgi:hypothetical protein